MQDVNESSETAAKIAYPCGLCEETAARRVAETKKEWRKVAKALSNFADDEVLEWNAAIARDGYLNGGYNPSIEWTKRVMRLDNCDMETARRIHCALLNAYIKKGVDHACTVLEALTTVLTDDFSVPLLQLRGAQPIVLHVGCYPLPVCKHRK